MSVADIKIDVKTCVGSVMHSFQIMKTTTVQCTLLAQDVDCTAATEGGCTLDAGIYDESTCCRVTHCEIHILQNKTGIDESDAEVEEVV